MPPSRNAERIMRSIRWYQRQMEGRPSPCRFFPSCSAYALEAVEVHGARRGTWLAARRLLRCRPFGPSGFDPVPEPVEQSAVEPHEPDFGEHHAGARPDPTPTSPPTG